MKVRSKRFATQISVRMIVLDLSDNPAMNSLEEAMKRLLVLVVMLATCLPASPVLAVQEVVDIERVELQGFQIPDPTLAMVLFNALSNQKPFKQGGAQVFAHCETGITGIIPPPDPDSDSKTNFAVNGYTTPLVTASVGPVQHAGGSSQAECTNWAQGLLSPFGVPLAQSVQRSASSPGHESDSEAPGASYARTSAQGLTVARYSTGDPNQPAFNQAGDKRTLNITFRFRVAGMHVDNLLQTDPMIDLRVYPIGGNVVDHVFLKVTPVENGLFVFAYLPHKTEANPNGAPEFITEVFPYGTHEFKAEVLLDPGQEFAVVTHVNPEVEQTKGDIVTDQGPQNDGHELDIWTFYGDTMCKVTNDD